MKIIIDKINKEPKHSITKNELEKLLGIIPNEWVGKAHIFRISSQMFDNSKWNRYVIQNNTTFNIMSRGIQKEIIVKDLLIELALIPNKMFDINGHRLSVQQMKKIEEIIQPYYNSFMIENE